MILQIKFIKIFFLLSVILNLTIQAASIKETVLVSNAGGIICKNYAEEVGGDINAFSNMNTNTLKIAEEMGYVDNLETYLFKIQKVKRVLQNQLLQTHGSKLNLYNNWCIKFYNGYQKGIGKAYQ